MVRKADATGRASQTVCQGGGTGIGEKVLVGMGVGFPGTQRPDGVSESSLADEVMGVQEEELGGENISLTHGHVGMDILQRFAVATGCCSFRHAVGGRKGCMLICCVRTL